MYFIKRKKSSWLHQTINEAQLRRNLANQSITTGSRLLAALS
jgi:hypothetical protein